ncbi:hypothetical protein [Roseivirga misakiensis]|uniref:Uncharacterized protein n=1 Tax=Roseivirga misakiensis TaxID=1563681 RepID=A0A1E5SY27_9BACT|nr:hypothetical protein [Roseivirga misakiensis]OEK04033.1 hypothetical protein BFP71_11085 [Roseivirga misakiensis]
MLYIKFDIKDPAKFTDFQKVFDHMLKTRQPGFEFEEEDIEGPSTEEEWNRMTDREWEELKKKWREEVEPEVKRYRELIPDYANEFLESYIGFDEKKAGVFAFDTLGIFNYLEFTFEVDMDKLEKFDETSGVVEFSTGNFPFGGMERFLMTLKAFDLIPTECYNGFIVYEFDWKNDFYHEAIDLIEKTREYKEKFR